MWTIESSWGLDNYQTQSAGGSQNITLTFGPADALLNYTDLNAYWYTTVHGADESYTSHQFQQVNEKGFK